MVRADFTALGLALRVFRGLSQRRGSGGALEPDAVLGRLEVIACYRLV